MNRDRSNSLRAVGWGFDFEGIAPRLLYGYDKLYYRNLHLHVASRRWQGKEGALRASKWVSARQVATTVFITAILCVPSRFREFNLMVNMRPQ